MIAEFLGSLTSCFYVSFAKYKGKQLVVIELLLIALSIYSESIAALECVV
jgi:hypothetical protein